MRAFHGTLNQLLAIYRDASLNDKVVLPQEVITLIDLFGLLWCEVAAQDDDAQIVNDIALSLQYIGITSNDPMELARHLRRAMTNLLPLFSRCAIGDTDGLRRIAKETSKTKIGACAYGVMRCIDLVCTRKSIDSFYDLRTSPFMPTLSSYLMMTREQF